MKIEQHMNACCPGTPTAASDVFNRAVLRPARTAFQYEHEHQDVRSIGRQLGVRYVVQGAVQIAGSRVKVSVALASAESGEELWSEQYQRRLADFLALQEDIAALVVASLESEVEREEMQRSLLMPGQAVSLCSNRPSQL